MGPEHGFRAGSSELGPGYPMGSVNRTLHLCPCIDPNFRLSSQGSTPYRHYEEVTLHVAVWLLA